MWFGIEGSLLQELTGESFGFLGGAVGLLKVVGVEGCAGSPGESFEIRGVDSVLGAIGLKFGIGSGGISLSQGGADVINNIGEGERR